MRTLAALTVSLLFAATVAADAHAEPDEVYVGAYVADVMALDFAKHTYTADFYLWFRWSNPDIDPSESFEFVNSWEQWGHTLDRSYEEPDVLPNGDLYQVVHVQGGFHQPFPLRSYPFDQQTISIRIEDTESETDAMVYRSDGATLDREVVLPGFDVGEPRIAVDVHEYPTNFGDPRLADDSIYSRATIEIPMRRPVLRHIVKVLGPIFCVMLCSFLMFLLPTPETRITVGITALLTTVALALNQNLPQVGYLILMDRIYITSYAFIVAGLALNLDSILRRDGRLARRPAIACSAIYVVLALSMIGEAMISG